MTIQTPSRPIRRRTWLLAGATAIAGAALSVSGVAHAEEPLAVTFIYSGAANDGGWTQTFDEARKALEASMGDKITTEYKEKIPESPQAARVIETAIQRGADVIVSNSYGFGEFMIEAAKKHPEVTFITSQWDNPGDLPNYVGFVNAPEDGAYIGGIAAGYVIPQGGKVGWVDAFPIPYDVRTINGFALGLAKSNPEATVQVVFTNSWTDASLTTRAAQSLADSGIDLLSSSLPPAAFAEVAESAGIPFIAAAVDGTTYAPSVTITSFEYRWAPMLEEILKEVMAGELDTSFRYAGMSTGSVDMGVWGGAYGTLSEEAKAAIQAEYDAVRSGEKAVFTGPLTDKTGKEVLADGEVMPLGGLRGMAFALPNVEGVDF